MTFDNVTNTMKMNTSEDLCAKAPSWILDLPKGPWDMDDESEDLDKLCELVRNQYLKHLRQTLLDNLDVSNDGFQKKYIHQIPQSVDKCLFEMEKKALRQCMIASIYREVMFNMINEVKASTENSLLYVLLRKIIESNSQLSLQDNYCNAKIKTEKCSSYSTKTNNISVNSENNSNTTTTTKTERIKDSSSSLLINDLDADPENKFNSTPSLSSYDVNIEISDTNVFDNLNSLLHSSCHSSYCSDEPMEVNHDNDSNEFTNLQDNSEQESNATNDILGITALLRDLQDSPEQQSTKLDERLIALELGVKNFKSEENCSKLPGPIYKNPNNLRPHKLNGLFKDDKIKSEPIGSLKNLQVNSEQTNGTKNDISSINALLRDLQDSPEQASSKLDERLIEFEQVIGNYKPLDDFSELPTIIPVSPNTIRPEKIHEILNDKFRSERVAKKYELQRSINEMPWELQISLNQRFDDLFGNNHTYESDPLSEEEERIIAHKRIVKLVVGFMTPYYKAHRINRLLFKSLAKLISKNLMDRAYDPDEATVARGVNEFFAGDRCITTIEDFYQ